MTFAYHRSLSPMIAVLMGLGFVEIIVIHIVAMALWGWKAAILLGLIGVSAMIALIAFLRSLRLPITLVDRTLTMRTGRRIAVTVDVADIKGFRDQWSAADLKRPDVLNMALITWPNIVLDLNRPMTRRRRQVSAVAHRVDDPAAFREAIIRAMSA